MTNMVIVQLNFDFMTNMVNWTRKMRANVILKCYLFSLMVIMSSWVYFV